MTITALLLVFTAAFCHATWNFYVKKIGGGRELVWLISLISNIFYLPWVVYIFWVEKPDIGMFEIYCVLVSSILHTVYFLLLQRGYRHGDLSLVYPLARSLGPIISMIFAVLFLNEIITSQILSGGLIIITGIFFLTGGFKKRAKNVTASIGYGLLVGFFIGSYTAWDAYVVSVIMLSPVLLDYASNTFRMVIFSPVAYQRWDIVKTQWTDHKLGVILIGVLSPLAYILFLYAITFRPVTLLAPVRETSVLISVLMGSIILGEGDLKRRLFWSVIILGGVALLATA
ncbi:DMT family transporter [Emcibacteraceae bacterium]|nr:DMT family transporter [Emcibacteraceae bacterium]